MKCQLKLHIDIEIDTDVQSSRQPYADHKSHAAQPDLLLLVVLTDLRHYSHGPSNKER